MWSNVAIGLVVVIVLFLGYVSTKESKFRYERSGVINAPADKIFPYISQLKLGEQWSPYEKVDHRMKKQFFGTDGQVGAAMDFEGNREAGSGRLEILGLVPNESVQIKLIMTAPMRAENLVEYRLTPEGAGTKFTWTMSGDGGFMGKLIATIIDCDKMIAGQFTVGINNLKTLIESKTP